TSLGTTQINATSDGISSSDRTLTVTDGFGITIVPYMDSKYKYKIVNYGESAGFEDVNYDDSDFSMGNASFGLIKPGYCDIYSLKYIKTLWPEYTDILLRKEFVLPAGVTNLKVYIAVDDDVQVFINGHDVSNGTQTHEMCAEWDYFEFPVDNSILKTGTNLLAVRGKDHGGVNFLDTKITADY
ncbi:MAG: sorting protein, partial [Euryarchaeota archaeon]|nr:sorting protein [Euryarchaeota archaeon]